MTSTGTYNNGSLENADIIAEAFERCGIDPDTIQARHVNSALRSITLLFSDWSTKGVKEWKVEQLTYTTATGFSSGAESIALDSRVIRVVTAIHRTAAGEDTPLYSISRDEYQGIPLKTQQGARPDRYFLDRQRDTPSMYLWPTLDNATSSLIINAFVRVQDVGTLANTPDIPFIWLEAICSELAARLAQKYAPERVVDNRALANIAFKNARGEDRDQSPTYIKANFGNSRRRR